MVFDLSRIEALLDLLGSPQRAYPAIHLTGTNGKTSTARMIDALLRAHGLRTGRYTSPHLETVRERISLDGEPVERGAVRRDLPRGRAGGELVDQRGAEESADLLRHDHGDGASPHSPTRRSTWRSSRSGSAAQRTRPTCCRPTRA